MAALLADVRTWGLDMSASPKSAGLVSIDWPKGACVKVHPTRQRDSDALVTLISKTIVPQGEYLAVDVPFGWPEGFGEFLTKHAENPAALPVVSGGIGSPWSSISHRRTDVVARDGLPRGSGFNVSFDKLGATAAAWSVIEQALANEGVRFDRSGHDPGSKIIETWPSAAWRRWAPDSPPLTACTWPMMQPILGGLLDVDSEAGRLLSAKSSHARDALVCALVARAFQLRQTQPPGDSDLEVARREGWIHLPSRGSRLEELRQE